MRRALALFALAACKDVSSYSTGSDHYEGTIVPADFLRAGIDPSVVMCLTLDTTRLQEGPGVITSSDGRFQRTPLRPMPQIWHDSLSTLSFGDGRVQNLVYVASESACDAGTCGGDDWVVVSLMQGGGVEARVMRGAPGAPDAGASSPSLFAVFTLSRASGACPY